MMVLMMIVQVESDTSSVNGEESRSFGVLTVTSSTNIDSYFATKLAKLRTKAEKNMSSLEPVLPAANHIASQEQTKPQQTAAASTEAGPAVDCDMAMVKRRKKKKKKVTANDSDCGINGEQVLHSKSVNSDGMSKKKKKRRHVDDLSDVTVSCDSDNMNIKSCKRKKVSLGTTAASEMTPEHISIRSKKWKKSKHVDCQTR